MPQKIFNNDLVAMCKSKITLTLNKPAYVGMWILDLSKVLMTSSIRITLKKIWNNSRLLFTETDSWMYEVTIGDLYEDFSKDKEIFDFSNYSADLKYYDDWSE